MKNENIFNNDPYTKLPNQFLEVLLQIKLQNYEIRVLLAIARKTFGFNKTRDFIKQRQLVTLTGISEPHISRTLKSLIKKNMLIRNSKFLEIQKDFKLWDIPEKTDLKNLPDKASFNNLNDDKNLPDEAIKLTLRGNKNLPDKACTKKTIKEAIQSKNINTPESDNKFKSQVEEVISYLNSRASKNFRSGSMKTTEKIRSRLNEGYNIEDFRKVIDVKVSSWKGDPKMDAYLRPETLFGTKFENYLNENIFLGVEKNGQDKKGYRQPKKV